MAATMSPSADPPIELMHIRAGGDSSDRLVVGRSRGSPELERRLGVAVSRRGRRRR
jgi:hypothetical protein